MNTPTPDPDNAATAPGERHPRRRPRRTPTVVILPPVAVPLDQQRRERAVAALTALFTQWWDHHGHHLDPAEHGTDQPPPDGD